MTGRHRDLPPATPDKITDGERDCLHLIAAGYTNPEIAKKLWISTGAVGSRVRRLLAKLGAHDRAQAVHHAWQHGLMGRKVWPVGETRNEGWLIEGHDQRAYAALSWELRDREPWAVKANTVWVLFHTRCGCTPDQHAEHVERCGCVYPGLPPCWEDDDDVFGWMYELVPADTPNALPVLEVKVLEVKL